MSGGKRLRFSRAQKAFLTGFLPDFFASPHHQPKNKLVTDFKEDVAEKFIEHFGLTEDLDAVRERVKRWFVNRKRDANKSGQLPSTSSGGNEDIQLNRADKASSKTIAEFFQHVQTRRISGRDVWARENGRVLTEQGSARYDVPSADGTQRGQHNKLKSELYAALPEDVKAEYERRAEEKNATLGSTLEEGTVDDEQVLRNQEQLSSVLRDVLTALPGRKNVFSVGDAIFSLNIAFRSPKDGQVHVRQISTMHNEFCFSKCNKFSRCKSIWTKFSKRVFSPDCANLVDPPSNRDSDEIQSRAASVDAEVSDESRPDLDGQPSASNKPCGTDSDAHPSFEGRPDDGLEDDEAGPGTELPDGPSFAVTPPSQVPETRRSKEDNVDEPPKKRQKLMPPTVGPVRRTTRQIVKPTRADAGITTPVKKHARRRHS